jgi:LysM repeat protein
MTTFTGKAGNLIAALVVAGASFLIPAGPVQAQAGRCGDRVTVGFGDSLYAIAERCDTTVPAIMAVNPLLPSPLFLFPGMTLLMPQVVAAPAPVPEMPASGVVRYVVRPGDTLSSIARAHNVPLAEIYRLNPNVDAARLRVGDALVLPGRAPPPAQPGTGTAVRYVVRPGDTLSSIARAHNIAMTEIYRLNPNIDAARLRVGDVVRLPGGVVATPRPDQPDQGQIVRYTVKPGDTLSGIARAHGLTLAQIYALNPDIDFQRLRVGQVVRLPGAATPTQPPATPTVTLTPARGAPGTVVQVSSAGFPASSPVKLLAGRNAARLREFRPVTSDNRGRVNVSIRIPDWAAEFRSIIFAFETQDGRLRAVSQPFRIVDPEPDEINVVVTGTLTREGAECQAMRGDDGKLYTLAGEFRGFRPGDRVRVEGRIAEVSICMQGTTIDVRRIEDAG